MSSLILKLIAAASMLIDHAGLILFPKYAFLRVIGRLAFPIYAFCVAEGFRYTRSRTKYFLRIFILGLLCQIVYTVVERDVYIGILLVFSISIIIMSLLDGAKKAHSGEKSPLSELTAKLTRREISKKTDRIISYSLLAAALAGAYFLSRFITVDYGFWGILVPVFTSLSDDKPRKTIAFAISLVVLSLSLTNALTIQFFCLLAVPLVAAYNGKVGKYKLKYFFYIFYPLHLVILYGISFILDKI